jgi:hypothetical protein
VYIAACTVTHSTWWQTATHAMPCCADRHLGGDCTSSRRTASSRDAASGALLTVHHLVLVPCILLSIKLPGINAINSWTATTHGAANVSCTRLLAATSTGVSTSAVGCQPVSIACSFWICGDTLVTPVSIVAAWAGRPTYMHRLLGLVCTSHSLRFCHAGRQAAAALWCAMQTRLHASAGCVA